MVGGYDVECIAVEVRSRELIVGAELQQLKDALSVSAKAMTELALSLSRAAILGSYIQNLVLKKCDSDQVISSSLSNHLLYIYIHLYPIYY